MTMILRFSILRCPLRSHANAQSPRRFSIDGRAITGYENRISCGLRAQRYLIIFRTYVYEEIPRESPQRDWPSQGSRDKRCAREMRDALECGMIDEIITLAASLERVGGIRWSTQLVIDIELWFLLIIAFLDAPCVRENSKRVTVLVKTPN